MPRPKTVEKPTVTHVLILSPVEYMPKKLFSRLRKHIGKLYRIGRLPRGFSISSGALGYWLIYESRGRRYAWSKCFFGKVNGEWYNYTYNRYGTPEDVLRSDFHDPVALRLGFKEHKIEHVLKPLHRKRTKRARATDESLRAKEAPTEYHWMRTPQRFDVEGVDTPKKAKEKRENA